MGGRKNTPGSAAAAATRVPPGSDRREGVKVKVSALRRGALDVPAGQRKLFSLCVKEKWAGWGVAHTPAARPPSSPSSSYTALIFFFSLPAFWLFYLSVLK